MKKILIVMSIVLSTFVLSGCKPEGGYTEGFNGLVVSENDDLYVWIPEVGNVLLPYSDRTTLTNHQEQYELQVGDWISISFSRTEDDIYILGDEDKTFVSDALLISVADPLGHNISIEEIGDNVELTIELIPELEKFNRDDKVFFFTYAGGELGLYNSYHVTAKEDDTITLEIPTIDLVEFMDYFVYNSFQYGTSSTDLP